MIQGLIVSNNQAFRSKESSGHGMSGLLCGCLPSGWSKVIVQFQASPRDATTSRSNKKQKRKSCLIRFFSKNGEYFLRTTCTQLPCRLPLIARWCHMLTPTPVTGNGNGPLSLAWTSSSQDPFLVSRPIFTLKNPKEILDF